MLYVFAWFLDDSRAPPEFPSLLDQVRDCGAGGGSSGPAPASQGCISSDSAAHELLERAVAIARAHGRTADLAAGLHYLDRVHGRVGDNASAASSCREAVPLVKQEDPGRPMGGCYSNLSVVTADPIEHERLLRARIEACRRDGDNYYLPTILHDLGAFISQSRGEREISRELRLEAMEVEAAEGNIAALTGLISSLDRAVSSCTGLRIRMDYEESIRLAKVGAAASAHGAASADSPPEAGELTDFVEALRIVTELVLVAPAFDAFVVRRLLVSRIVEQGLLELAATQPVSSAETKRIAALLLAHYPSRSPLKLAGVQVPPPSAAAHPHRRVHWPRARVACSAPARVGKHLSGEGGGAGRPSDFGFATFTSPSRPVPSSRSVALAASRQAQATTPQPARERAPRPGTPTPARQPPESQR